MQEEKKKHKKEGKKRGSSEEIKNLAKTKYYVEYFLTFQRRFALTWNYISMWLGFQFQKRRFSSIDEKISFIFNIFMRIFFLEYFLEKPLNYILFLRGSENLGDS